MKKIVFALVFILFSLASFAQYGYRDSNRIGIFFGANQCTLNTNNFETKPDLGWNAGLSLRGNFYDNWDMVYAIQFSENNFSVATKNLVLLHEDVNYTLPSAQISLQLSYIFIEDHLSFEFGPIVQFNGKLKTDIDNENNIINGTTLMAKDIEEISKFNLYPTAGITFGVKHLRLNVSYQYGLMNTLGNLNSKNPGTNFKGNTSILNGNLIIYL
jgi:hypothetical protein